MKNRIQGIIIGILIGTILSSGLVFGKQSSEWAEIFYNNIKIFIDGKEIVPKDANGNVVEPFIMNGTTYLPVRAVSNAFGKDVAWDGNTQSVYIGKKNLSDDVSVGPANVTNLGIATVVGDDVYLASAVGNGLYKMSLRTLTSEKISDDAILFIQNINGSVYYVDVVNNQLRKFVDGINDTVICNELCYTPQFVGEYIYYLNTSDYFLYRVSVNGGESEKVLDVPCNVFYVDGQKLYFEDINESRFCVAELQTAISVAKTKPTYVLWETDSTSGEIPGRTPEEIGATVLFSGVPDTVNVVGDAIYFSDYANGYAISRYKDGAVTQLSSGITARYVNVYDGHIYYTNMNDYVLYRMNLDGSDVRKLSGEGEMAINNCIVDGKVIYAYMGASGDMGTVVIDTEGNVLCRFSETAE